MEKSKGITLIALIITIIVLLILAGVSLSLSLGNNGVLTRTSDAKLQEEKGRVSEEIQFTIADATSDYLLNVTGGNPSFRKSIPYYIVKDSEGKITYSNTNTDIFMNNCPSAINVILEDDENPIVVDENGEIVSGGTDNGVVKGIYQAKDSKLWYPFTINLETGIVKADEGISDNSEYISTTKRSGIEVGDYVKYIPPAKEPYATHLTSAYTGYSSDQTLSQEYNMWKVLTISDDGTIQLFPVRNFNNQRNTTIRFKGARAWNNIVYILHEMSDYLYSDTENGITAKSMAFSDFENLIIEGEKGDTVASSTGKQKILKYWEDHVAELDTWSNVTGKNGLTATYNIRNVLCREPDIYPYVKNKPEDKYYTESTFASRASSNGYRNVNTRSVSYTESGAWNIGYKTTDYLNPKVYDVIKWGQYGYLATRGLELNSYPGTDFVLYVIDYNNYICCHELFDGAYDEEMYGNLVPLVTLSNSVKIKISEDGTNSNTPHEVYIK